MEITAAQVKELRERTGVGMMECKKALVASNGDMKVAIEELRKAGRAKADKKADRVAAEGVVIIRTAEDGKYAVMLEINSETDFVARDENFLVFADSVAQTVLSTKIDDVNTLLTTALSNGSTVEEARQTLVAKIGENINIRRIVIKSTTTGSIGTYLHGSRIGVLVELDCDNAELAKDIAMQVAACKPLVINQSDVPNELVEKEREIFMAQAASSGKPQDILEKMVNGKLKKFVDEVSLMGQAFVKDPEVVVSNLLGKNRAKVISFTRFEVGEGIEKVSEDFVEAVMAQAGVR